MPIDVTAELMIVALKEKVTAYATDTGNDPVWVIGIVQANY